MKARLLTITLVFTLIISAVISGCGNQTGKNGVQPGYYVNTYEEEIDGQKVKRTDYLILLDDAHGFISAQDTVGLKWTPDEISCEDGSVMKIKPGKDGAVTAEKDGVKTEYKPTSEDLPEELYERIDAYLMGKDYSGSYVSEKNGNKIVLTTNPIGTYDVTVSLKNLCDMNGEGNNVDGAVEIGFTDPNGGHVYGVFFSDMDKYVLRITQSEFDKIKDQTDFVDFVKE